MENENKKIEVDDSNLGGWSISRELFDTIAMLLDGVTNPTILELGSGTGTKELRKIATVISVEHDPQYLPETHAPHKGFIVPLCNTTGWYEKQQMYKILKHGGYDLILVDGPLRNGRHGFLQNLWMFETDCAIIIDDTNRKEIKKMVDSLAKKFKRDYAEFEDQEKRKFAVFYRKI